MARHRISTTVGRSRLLLVRCRCLLANHPPIASIFSTRVISGAKSTPDLNKLLERKQAGRTNTAVGDSMMLIRSVLVVCSESAIVAPLETLNTNLNYRILDDFIGKVTDSTTKFVFTPSIESTTAMANPMSQISNSATAHSTPILTPYGESLSASSSTRLPSIHSSFKQSIQRGIGRYLQRHVQQREETARGLQ